MKIMLNIRGAKSEGYVKSIKNVKIMWHEVRKPE
jgi:hypothetical protein